MENHQISNPIFFEESAGISEIELAVIGLAAYIGNFPNKEQWKRVRASIPLTGEINLGEFKKRAEDMNFLRNRYYSWDDKVVAPFYLFPVIFNILTLHSNWHDAYRTARLSQTALSVFSWKIAEAICKDDRRTMTSVSVIRPWTYEGRAYEYCLSMLYVPEFQPVINTLPNDQFEKLISVELDHLLNNDIPFLTHKELYRIVDAYHGARCYSEAGMLKDKITAYLFFYNAQEPDWNNSAHSYWTYAVKAIQALYRRKITETGYYFKLAFDQWNKVNKDKNLFHSPLLNFYLMLYYAYSDGESGRKKADIFLRKPYLENNAPHFPAAAVARYAVLNEPSEKQEWRVSYYIRDMGQCYHSFVMGSILAHFLGYSANDINVDDNSFLPEARWAIPNFELSPYKSGSDSAETGQLLGGAPLLADIRRKSQWEKILQDICDSNATDIRDKRIVYELKGDNRFTIREQKRTKSGGWTSGMELQPYYLKERDSMDEQDKDVLRYLNEHYYSTTAEEILPFLVGCDRVFYSGGDGYQNVTIVQDKPYIEIEKKASGFKISSNITELPKENGFAVRKDSNVHYTVFNFTKAEHSLLKQLLLIKEIPEEAEPVLKKAIRTISGKIEVHSDFFDEASTIEKVKGESRITLRLQPVKEGIDLSVGVRPIKDSGLFLTPGKGSATVYDSRDGNRFQVKRNLKKELANLELLMNNLPADIEEDFLAEDITCEMSAQEVLELLDFAQSHPEEFTTEWPHGESLRLKGSITPKAIHASMVSKERWFEMEGDVRIDKDTILSMAEFMNLFVANGGRKFIQLSDGDFIALSDSLRKQMRKLETASSSKGRISLFQVGALAEMVRSEDSFITADERFTQLEQRIADAASMSIETPTALKTELRPYQKEGLDWMLRLFKWGAGACLADDMGLGKTVQAIVAILALKGPALVVAPSSVILNWSSELERFAPSLKCSVLNESSDRAKSVTDASEQDVVLCSYGLLIREADVLSEKEWSIVCLDEAHTIKNRDTKMSAAAMGLKAGARLALTGTPLQNNLAEMWNIFQFINPGLLDSFEKFSERYISGKNAAENQKRLKNVIRPFILRRKKDDVIEDLPEKTEIIRHIELSPSETTAYEAMRAQASNELENSSKVDINALAQITRLRQGACSISLVQKDWFGDSSKVTAAVELIKQIRESGNRVLVFSQFTSFLSMVRTRLGDDNTYYLDGSTPIRKRELMVNEFQRGEGNVFFISLKAGGLGLNLTGANYVLHLDPWWNPAIEQQATDRAYRIGQDRNVTVYHLISARTIEEKMLRLHKVKRDMADSLLAGTDVSGAITLEELRELVKRP